ncbi:DUF4303 domain-containing protein [Flavobacterium aestivum]|uniref:DUF4303 domain-containing protein n=1 Tax=Flavobacterium aestivum TaxID=3003257 RepID=UPI002285677B|nr:DUF4303 domain-containing protein [Flavobacterium aestivum]
MNLNLSQFENLLENSTIKVIENIKENEDRKSIIGFSLFSDSDATSVSISYNTKDYLNTKSENDPNEDKEYFKWYPAEWKEEGVISNEIDALSRMMYEASKSRNISLTEYRQQIFESIINTLINIKEKGYFSDLNEKFALVFYATDYFVAEEEIEWVKKLNNKELSSEFENWRKKF